MQLLSEPISISIQRAKAIRVETELSLGKTHFVTVKAKVKGLNHAGNNHVTVLYNRIEVYQNTNFSNYEDFLVWMLVFAIALFITSLAGCILYYKKYRKADKILTYEMQDIKNAVQFSGMNLSISEDSQQSIERKRAYVGINEENI